VAGGGSYNVQATWETSPGAADSPAVPTASDDVIGTALSGQLTITASAVAKTVDLSLYTATLTHNSNIGWTISGSVTFGTLMTYSPTATSTITLNATGTFTTAGLLMPLITLSVGTTTLGDNLSFMASKVMFYHDKALIVTGNKRDFPSSVFDIVEVISLEKGDGDMQSFCVLEFNKEKFDERLARLKEVKD